MWLVRLIKYDNLVVCRLIDPLTQIVRILRPRALPSSRYSNPQLGFSKQFRMLFCWWYSRFSLRSSPRFLRS
jgi:hypothetical protein